MEFFKNIFGAAPSSKENMANLINNNILTAEMDIQGRKSHFTWPCCFLMAVKRFCRCFSCIIADLRVEASLLCK